MAKEDKKQTEKKDTSWFGGMLGQAESALRGRKRQVDDAVDAAEGKERPGYSKKWTE